MNVTVLWEDQISGAKGFGPHALLLACLEDAGLGFKWDLGKRVSASPKKGNGALLNALKHDCARLSTRSHVIAVFDRDKAHEMWKPTLVPACMSGTLEKLKAVAPGDYQVVFLVENVESLCRAATTALGEARLANKPTPDTRDRLLNRLAAATRESRARAQIECPSFGRLVDVVGRCLG